MSHATMRPYKSEKCVCGQLVSRHSYPTYQAHMDAARIAAEGLPPAPSTAPRIEICPRCASALGTGTMAAYQAGRTFVPGTVCPECPGADRDPRDTVPQPRAKEPTMAIDTPTKKAAKPKAARRQERRLRGVGHRRPEPVPPTARKPPPSSSPSPRPMGLEVARIDVTVKSVGRAWEFCVQLLGDDRRQIGQFTVIKDSMVDVSAAIDRLQEQNPNARIVRYATKRAPGARKTSATKGAYDGGWRAGRRHTPANANPHPKGSDEFKAWEKGRIKGAAGVTVSA